MPQNGSLSGGQKLRKIRERQKLNQFEFDLSGVVTQANLSRIETGRIFPSHEKLKAILDRLHPTFNERREVLSAFGYLPPYPIPDAAEIEAACRRCRPVLDEIPMPAYLQDFLTRFLAWNDLFTRLLGDQADSDHFKKLHNMPLFKAQFDSRLRMADYMENMEPSLLAEMEDIRDRLAPHCDEQWYDGFIAELCEDAQFHRYWQATEGHAPSEKPVTAFAASIIEPVEFTIPGEETELQFYANVDPLTGDDRFRMVYLIPATAMTIRQVERWRAEMQEK